MADSVSVADVLTDAHFGWVCTDAIGEPGPLQRDALLAHGGGDPVVIMPDGTLRRLVVPRDTPCFLADPVEPT